MTVISVMYIQESVNLDAVFLMDRCFLVILIHCQGLVVRFCFADVSWLKFRSGNVEPLSNLYTVTRDAYHHDHILSSRRFSCRCTLTSPKFIGCGHIPTRYH